MLIRRFASSIPANDSRQLKENFGEYAYNTRLWDGSLRAFKEVLSDDGCKPIPCSTEAYLCDVEPVRVVDGELIRPNGEKCFLDRPNKPIITVGSGGSDPVVFMITAVNTYGDESARSEPSQIYRVEADTPIKITSSGLFRVYGRVFTSIDGSITKDEFQNPDSNLMYFGEYEDVAEFGFDISVAPIYNSNNMCRPKCIKCITHNEDGYYAIWTDTDVYISERHEPAMYPIRYKQSIGYQIEEVHPFYEAFFVHTKGKPQIIKYQTITNGADAGMIDIQAIPYSDILPIQGMGVRTSFGSMYPSRLGLVALTPSAISGMQIVTNDIISEDKFGKYIPTVSCWYNGVFYGWNDKVGFAFDMKENQFGQFELQNWINIRPNAKSAWVDVDGWMYVEYGEWTDEDGNKHNAGTFKWDGGNKWMPAVWKSKWFTEPAHKVYSRAKVAGGYVVGTIFELHGRKSGLIYRKEITDERPFPIKMKRDIEFQIVLKLPKSDIELQITEVHVTSNLIEMAGA